MRRSSRAIAAALPEPRTSLQGGAVRLRAAAAPSPTAACVDRRRPFRRACHPTGDYRGTTPPPPAATAEAARTPIAPEPTPAGRLAGDTLQPGHRSLGAEATPPGSCSPATPTAAAQAACAPG